MESRWTREKLMKREAKEEISCFFFFGSRHDFPAECVEANG
jgi:hypothetical protein